MAKQSENKPATQRKKRTPAKRTPKREPVFPWDRQQTETDRAWSLFVIYRDMQIYEGRRSGPELAKREGVTRQMIEKYMTLHKWTDRVAKYDAFIDQKFKQPKAANDSLKIIDEQLKTAQRMRAVGTQMLAQVAELIRPTKNPDGSPKPAKLDAEKYLHVMVRLLKDSVTIERDALGMKSTPTIETGDGDIVINNNLQVNKTVVIALPDNNRG